MLSAAASSLSNNGSYSNDRTSAGTGEPELATDLASGGFFHADYKKYRLPLLCLTILSACSFYHLYFVQQAR